MLRTGVMGMLFPEVHVAVVGDDVCGIGGAGTGLMFS